MVASIARGAMLLLLGGCSSASPGSAPASPAPPPAGTDAARPSAPRRLPDAGRPDVGRREVDAPAGCHQHADCQNRRGCGGKGLGPIVVEGDACLCERASGRCALVRFGPVPCKSFRDCWYERSPVLHPVRSARPRKRPVKPCVDGEIDVRCGSGRCQILGWDC